MFDFACYTDCNGDAVSYLDISDDGEDFYFVYPELMAAHMLISEYLAEDLARVEGRVCHN